MNIPLNINLAIAGSITAALLPVLGLRWTITTVDEGIGVRLSFFNGPREFFYIIDGQIHMEYYNRAMEEDVALKDKAEAAVENFVWTE
jgi:hypothetical protein